MSIKKSLGTSQRLEATQRCPADDITELAGQSQAQLSELILAGPLLR